MPYTIAMTIYKKTSSIGAFAKKGEDYQDQAILTVLNEGKRVSGEFGEQEVFLMQMPNGESKNMTMNRTSINNMIDAYGADSDRWVNQTAKVHLILQNVQGKMVRVAYLAHPEAVLDEASGQFVLPSATKEALVHEFPPLDTDAPPF